ncbi:hypothetical protein AAW51_3949 [Caldimonas brevitalea]|uniref:Uncharacterized protein n=1 Tax=Caldimonas brevitalea TaxID=413882 RepID=A0A0G3BVT4_9BURK|nr:hypothetical protein AAW51_3949 [Caldimonas brevitalea]
MRADAHQLDAAGHEVFAAHGGDGGVIELRQQVRP